MINFFVCSRHNYTVASLLREWDVELHSIFRILAYEQVADVFQETKSLVVPAGTLIFGDLDRLSEDLLAVAETIAKAAKVHGMKVFNQPREVLRRFELLRKLHELGINDFNAYRFGEKVKRFPVFIRMANEHSGSLSKLLYSQAQVDKQFEELCSLGVAAKDLIVVEYVHTADTNGVFRKYSAFLIGDSFVPRHLFFGREWVTKLGDNLPDPAMKKEELAYIDAIPHPYEDLIRRVFEMAKISYGRIDYGIANGKIQVWEINTNPGIMSRPQNVDVLRFQMQKRIAERIGQAFRAASTDAPEELTLLAHGHEMVGRMPNSMAVGRPTW